MPPILETKELGKSFLLAQKEPGILGSLRTLFQPRMREVVAVQNITFQVESGELVAFIGPNGAGKSTTIKMLTGILYPSSGEAKVLGFVPWKERGDLAFHIGSVFGQRSQMWLHLPPSDTFRLLGKIYEIPDHIFNERVEKMVELFDLKEILFIPVRKLSLGQRMKCEIAAALIHDPKIIFLDEPTIGLDVIAKEKIRELILTANSEAGVTIFLTSHDAGDIEKLCKRVIVIDQGRILLDTDIQSLKRSSHFSMRTIGVRLSKSSEGFLMDGVEVIKKKGNGMKLRLDTTIIPIEKLMSELMKFSSIEDITIRNPSLEEIIAYLYRTKKIPHDEKEEENGSDAQAPFL